MPRIPTDIVVLRPRRAGVDDVARRFNRCKSLHAKGTELVLLKESNSGNEPCRWITHLLINY